MTSQLPLIASGLATGLALIAAIGAQNAFLLRHGLRGQQVLPVVLACFASDVVGLVGGTLGVGAVIARYPAFTSVATVAGGLFVIAFALQSAWRVLHPGALTVDEAGPRTSRAVITAMALTWLNPHFYLDTFVLLGAISNSHGETGRWFFVGGALLGSALWFPTIGFGARALRGVFARQRSWQVLDAVIAVTMFGLGVGLLTSAH